MAALRYHKRPKPMRRTASKVIAIHRRFSNGQPFFWVTEQSILCKSVCQCIKCCSQNIAQSWKPHGKCSWHNCALPIGRQGFSSRWLFALLPRSFSKFDLWFWFILVFGLFLWLNYFFWRQFPYLIPTDGFLWQRVVRSWTINYACNIDTAVAFWWGCFLCRIMLLLSSLLWAFLWERNTEFRLTTWYYQAIFSHAHNDFLVVLETVLWKARDRLLGAHWLDKHRDIYWLCSWNLVRKTLVVDQRSAEVAAYYHAAAPGTFQKNNNLDC